MRGLGAIDGSRLTTAPQRYEHSGEPQAIVAQMRIRVVIALGRGMVREGDQRGGQ